MIMNNEDGQYIGYSNVDRSWNMKMIHCLWIKVEEEG